MPTLNDIPIERIAEPDLLALVASGAREGQHLEAKAGTYPPGFNHEFLKDIGAFANAEGGHLMVGVDEAGGALNGFSGFAGDADAELRRFEQIAQHGFDKVVPGLRMHAVPLAAGSHVLVVRVPPSYDAPHQIESAGTAQHKIFIRVGRLVEQARTEQLAAMFSRGPQRLQRADQLRAERIASIAGGDVPCVLMDANALVVHLVPLASFESAAIPVAILDGERARISPLTEGSCNFAVNANGLLAFVNPTAKFCTAYVQVYRTGVIESLRCGVRFRPPSATIDRVSAQDVERDIIRATFAGISSLRALEIGPPYAIYASLINVGGAVYTPVESFPEAQRLPNQVLVTRHVLPDIPAERRLAVELLPIFDEIANAAGHRISPTAQRASY